MAYIEVDIDLDEFETYELCKELSRRCRKNSRQSLTDAQKQELKSDLEDLIESIGIAFTPDEIKTLDDKMKMEHLQRVWNKYTSAQLEQLLPE